MKGTLSLAGLDAGLGPKKYAVKLSEQQLQGLGRQITSPEMPKGQILLVGFEHEIRSVLGHELLERISRDTPGDIIIFGPVDTVEDALVRSAGEDALKHLSIVDIPKPKVRSVDIEMLVKDLPGPQSPFRKKLKLNSKEWRNLPGPRPNCPKKIAASRARSKPLPVFIAS
jgi:hypothetical protein